MVEIPFSRRKALVLVGAALAIPRVGYADSVVDLNWNDLLPEGQSSVPQALQGLIPHDSADLASQQPESTGIRTDWNGKTVRLPGYMIPIDFSGTGVTAFILAPFVGACVHVPPPPANQLVFVTTDKPYESSGLFEAVNVTGMFGTSSLATQLAEIGYALSADRIEPFFN
jgi:hypothetical protein